jgi:hypothetical protein
VWVRADALVTPGAAGAGAGAAGGDFFTGPVLEQNRKAGTAGAAAAAVGPVQITLLTVAGCYTRGFPCTQLGCFPTISGPCITRQPVLCSLVCQQAGGPGPVGTWRDPEGTFACPPSIGCPTRPSPCGGGIPNPGEWVQRGAAQPLMAQQGPIGQTGWLGCGHTIARICTLYCHPFTLGAPCGPGPVITVVAHCPSAVDACPTRLCGGGGGEQANPQAQAAAPGGAGQVSAQCQMSLGLCPTHLLGCTGATAVTVCYCGPGPVSMHPGCPSPQAQGGAETIGPTGWLHCGHTLAKICTFQCLPPFTLGSPCGPGPVMTVVAHCPSAVDACPTRLCGGGGGEQANPQAQAAAPGGAGQVSAQCQMSYGPCPTHLLGCTGATAVTVCYCGPGPVSMHPGCPSPQIGAAGGAAGGPIGQTGWLHCGHTLATVCTLHCHPFTLGAPCGPGPVITVVGHCASAVDGCPTAMCGGAGGEQVHPQAMMAGGGGVGTSATVCTHYLHCPPQTQNCTYDTVCTQVGCPPRGGGEAGAITIPTGQYGPQCPTFGFTCTYVHCPPITIVTQGLGCPPTNTCPPTGGYGCPPETIVTQGLGCPPTSTCPPTGGYGCPPETIVTRGFGCPPTSTCPPTYAPGCGGTVAGGTGAAGPAAAAYTYHQGCPTFGFTCTYVHCPPA